MADTGKQSPLGQNVLGGILKNDCLQINTNAAYWMGASKNNDGYSPGHLVTDTVLRLITWSINWGWECGRGAGENRLTDSTYDNIIKIGDGVCEALGNAKPPTYFPIDPQGVWAGTTAGGSTGPDGFPCKSIQYRNTLYDEDPTPFLGSARPGPANAWYSISGDVDQAQCATWYPYNTTNVNHEITKWGWIRCHALQAWCEFNHHGNLPTQTEPKYEDFAGSFLSADSFINSENQVITAGDNAEDFMEGTFSNMDDLITSDVSGVNLATKEFGIDLGNLGKLFDPRKLDKFGFPSTLLQIIYENGALVQDLNLALAGAGLSAKEITTISNGTAQYVSASQEKKIYSAFLLISGNNLKNVLSPMLNQKPSQRVTATATSSDSTGTKFRTLADCLDVKRLFPLSYSSLTVPIYNTVLGLETGSKTYYLIYKNGTVNASDLNSTSVKNNVGTLFTQGNPPIFDDLPDNPDAALPKGFDSYLGGPNVVVPSAIGLAAGALRYSMLQINNITNLLPGELGHCIPNLELMSDNVSTGPDAATGTLAKPIDEELHAEIPAKLGIGSGPAGTYTHSDFFGCMSGLPYPWTVINNKINQTGASQPVERSRLNKIYEQMYLTVTWEKAHFTITVIPYFVNVLPSRSNPANPAFDPLNPPGPGNEPYLDYYSSAPTENQYSTRTDDLYYRVEFARPANGGGYSRGFAKGDSAKNPVVTITPNNCNASVTSSVNTNNRNASPFETGPIYSNTFGRVSGDYDTGTPYLWANDHVTSPASTSAPASDSQVNSYIASNCPQETITTEAPPTGTYDAYYTGATNQPGDTYKTPAGGGVSTQTATGTTFWTSPGNSVTQNYIDQANVEIVDIASTTSGDYRGGVTELNLAWDILGKQLKVEQRARYIALTPVEIPRSPFVNSYETLSTFVDAIPKMAQDIRPHMSAQTIEMIVDRFCNIGQSTIAMMRQERNQERLNDCGIPMNNNIPAEFSNETLNTLITNGTVTGAREGIRINNKEWTNPSWPYNPGPEFPPSPVPSSRYIPPERVTGETVEGGTFDPIIIDIENPQVGPYTVIGPYDPPGGGGGGGGSGEGGGGGGSGGGGGGGGDDGGGGGDGDPPIIGGGGGGGDDGGDSTLLPSQPTPDEAIERVIKCNCDCWDILGQ